MSSVKLSTRFYCLERSSFRGRWEGGTGKREKTRKRGRREEGEEERAEEGEGWRQEKKQQQEEQRQTVEKPISKINHALLRKQAHKGALSSSQSFYFPETQVLYNSSQHSKTEINSLRKMVTISFIKK